MRNGKLLMTEGRELTNQENIRKLGKNETNTYLKRLEANNIKQAEMKKKKSQTNDRITRNATVK